MAKIYDFKALLNSYEKSPQNRRKTGFHSLRKLRCTNGLSNNS